MTDDLVKRLRSKIIVHTDAAVWMLEAADRIEKLEAAIENAKYFLEMHPAYSDADCRVLIKKALAELEGELDD
jgi:hypothetical protein